MAYLSAGDWLIVGVYLAGIILFGVWCGKGQQGTKDYFLGSRNIPWWGVGLSIVATETSALTFIGVPAMAYGGDLTFLQIIIGYVIARILLAALLVPHYFKGEIYSPYQLFDQAFGPAAKRTAGGLFLISGTLAAGVRVYVTCIPIQLLLGVEIGSAILLFVGLSLVYTYLGGIRAVIWTDAVQFFLFMAGGLFTLFYIPTLIEGGLWQALETAGEQGKLEWFKGAFSLSLPPYNIWMGLIGATAMVCSSHGVDQLVVQRVLACRSPADGRKALILSAVIVFPLFFVFLLTGTLLWAYYQTVEPAIPIPTIREGFRQNDYVYPIFILTEVPPLLKGLLIVAILSAAMSSVSSALSALASVSTMDFVRGAMGRARDDSFYFRLSRASTLFWGAILIAVAYLSQKAVYVLNLAFSLSGLTNGAMLGGLILALVWKSGRAIPVVAGMLVSLGSMVAIHFIPKSKLAGLWERHLGAEIGWPWYTLIGTVITIGVAALLRMILWQRPSIQDPEAPPERIE